MGYLHVGVPGCWQETLTLVVYCHLKLTLAKAQHLHSNATSRNLPSLTVMSLLVDYASSEDEGAGSSTSTGIPKFTSAARVVAAPDVSLEVE